MPDEIPKKYSWNGQRWSLEEAEIVGRFIESMGNPSPSEVLDAARPASSPIHKFFDWDDSTAAESWRLSQARYIVRSLRIQIVGKDDKAYSIRAFSLVKEKESTSDDDKDDEDEEESESTHGRSRYFPFGSVQRSPRLAHKVMEQARDELRKWYEVNIGYYQTLSGLDRRFISVFQSIEDLFADVAGGST